MRIQELDIVAIVWSGLPCATRCRYCRESSGGKTTSVTYRTAREVATRFVNWSKYAEYRPKVEFSIGHSYDTDLATLVDFLSFPKEQGLPAWNRLPVNGLALRTRDELLVLFDLLRSAGIEAVDIAFFGVGANHDRWAGRIGDFGYLMLMADVAAEVGLKRAENIVLRKSSLVELTGLLEILDRVPGLEHREPNLMDHLGRGRLVEHERLTTADLANLPYDLRNSIDPDHWRPESEWIHLIEMDQEPEITKHIAWIAVDEETADYLECTSCEIILNDLLKLDRKRRCSEPSMKHLAESYGARGNDRLYAFRDIEWKWVGRYYAEMSGQMPPWLDRHCSTVVRKYGGVRANSG